MHDLAREALAAQLLVELELERHRVRALALELVAVERLHREHQVVGVELVVVPVDADPDPAAVAQGARDVLRVQRGDRGRDLRHVLAEARAERAVVRLDLVGAELVGLRDVAQLLDVELLQRDVGEPLDRGALLARRRRRRRRAAAGAP